MQTTAGKLGVVIMEGKGLKDKDVFGKMDPYINLRIGSQKWRSKTVTGGGKNPTWNQSISLGVITGTEALFVEAYDEDAGKDDFIGSGSINLADAVRLGTLDTWINLRTEHDSTPQPNYATATGVAQAQQPANMAPQYQPPPVQYQAGYPGFYPNQVPMVQTQYNPGYPAPAQPSYAMPPQAYAVPPQAVPVMTIPQPGYPGVPVQYPYPMNNQAPYPNPPNGYYNPNTNQGQPGYVTKFVAF
ncbi:C2-domain-containing protein [Rozella allomycis CSF55]|uniref:C2 calcium/lipid-binding, CaLB domain-containing protein n=1 Tax=Rozella allomycis (strain CSF55) TaxID=988480 RepID=A0A075AUK4_ROZAC|nr:C2 calcium/lipid-binding, CaLB domain-containing protein [Rozella allomycis CSF55]RKP20676.1 C2-domain-containing protein [Rozella allomycis CSF55]|eukprot:EPZ32192.1 C2 calcium/lipid-binding, CaLB domain-containing protein [Rozella allomycis CSF55]